MIITKTVKTIMDENIARGQLYFANLDPVVGSEQGGIRPVVICQNNMGNRYSPTTIVAPVTSKFKKRLPTHIALYDQPEIENGSIILLEQIRTLDKSRLGKYIGQIKPNQIQQLDTGLSVSLGLIKTQEEPMLITLCKSCSNHYWDTGLYWLRRPKNATGIRGSCDICTRPGFDYEVTRKTGR